MLASPCLESLQLPQTRSTPLLDVSKPLAPGTPHRVWKVWANRCTPILNEYFRNLKVRNIVWKGNCFPSLFQIKLPALEMNWWSRHILISSDMPFRMWPVTSFWEELGDMFLLMFTRYDSKSLVLRRTSSCFLLNILQLNCVSNLTSDNQQKLPVYKLN